MWLFTSFGFFSIVRKADETQLTIRSRARGDLLRLRQHYLPQASALFGKTASRRTCAPLRCKVMQSGRKCST
jgi:hypothetical protein